MARYGTPLEQALGVPVVDPSQAATGMALAALRLGYRTRTETAAPRALAGE